MIQRRTFFTRIALASTTIASLPLDLLAADAAESTAGGAAVAGMDAALRRDWLARWEQNIIGDSRNRYCDKETGEELGWHVSPFLNGYYYGFMATRDSKWIERLIDWTDACLKRAVKEPDGFPGWPKGDGGGGESKEYAADSPDPRWKNSSGVLWAALVPYDDTLRKIFVANHKPDGWGGLSATPWFLSISRS